MNSSPPVGLTRITQTAAATGVGAALGASLASPATLAAAMDSAAAGAVRNDNRSGEVPYTQASLRLVPACVSLTSHLMLLGRRMSALLMHSCLPSKAALPPCPSSLLLVFALTIMYAFSPNLPGLPQGAKKWDALRSLRRTAQGRSSRQEPHLDLVCEQVVWHAEGAMQRYRCHADPQRCEQHRAHTAIPTSLSAPCAQYSSLTNLPNVLKHK